MRLPNWLRPKPLVVHNLLGPDLVCAVSIDFLATGDRRVYCSKFTGPAPEFAKIVEGIVRAGVELGAQHGVTISFQPQPATSPPPASAP